MQLTGLTQVKYISDSSNRAAYGHPLRERRFFDPFTQPKQTEDIHFVNRRTPPIVVIIGTENNILFVNGCRNALSRLLKNPACSEEREAKEQLIQVLSLLRISVLDHDRMPVTERPLSPPTGFFAFRGTMVSCQGLLLRGTENAQRLVMVLIENISNAVRYETTLPALPHFSPREKSVIDAIKKGFTNKEIACALDIGVHTVKDHLKRIMKKVGVHTRSGIAGKLVGR